MKLLYILLLLGFFKCVLLYKLYTSMPALELKRQARRGNKRAETLYKVANYETGLDVLLWVAGTILGTILFVWSVRTVWWLAAILAVATAWLIIWTPAPRYMNWIGALSSLTATPFSKILAFLNPILIRLASLLPPSKRIHLHTGLYEKEDLLKLLDRQNKQLDNRIDDTDLRIANGAMTFGDKPVRQVMTPRSQVRIVGANETAGPLLMDDLHKTGHSRFPVAKDGAKSASPDIVGTLYLKDIIGYEGGGKVKELARKEVYYINEDSNLRQALDAFLKTHHHLLMVVNSFEEIAGILSIEVILEQIIGQPKTYGRSQPKNPGTRKPKLKIIQPNRQSLLHLKLICYNCSDGKSFSPRRTAACRQKYNS
jgi:CBS domain containing-hemolysin-like protein